jgi:hypothetical protein
VLERVRAFSLNGHAALSDYADHRDPVSPQATFSALMRQFPFLQEHFPDFVKRFDPVTGAAPSSVESFAYWSKEQFDAKPVISATMVHIFRGDDDTTPGALVVSTQIFATHYVNGSVSVTALVRDHPGSQLYLAYLNRSDLDVLSGLWGGLVRMVLERRLKAEAPGVLETLRARLETGPPSAQK